MTILDPLVLSPLEIASGVIAGDGSPKTLPVPEGSHPLSVLEAAILPALLKPPCLVSFSGGRDSSAVLAVATKVARREGLQLPVPMTLRYPDIPEADETEWQESVIAYLHISDWDRREITEELEMLGPVALEVLRRHGLLWPTNAYVHEPMIERASGGSFLTGWDGDGLLGGWRWRQLGDVLGRRARPSGRTFFNLMHVASPRPVRRAVTARRHSLSMPWLRPAAAARIERNWLMDKVAEPIFWAPRVKWWRERRYVQSGEESLMQLAADHDVSMCNPFLDERFLAELGAAAPRVGVGDRTALMTFLFSDLLPPPVLSRASKALFVKAFWGEATREFLRSWDGSGVDEDLVDPDALAATWAADSPSGQTALLLHSVWLHALESRDERSAGLD